MHAIPQAPNAQVYVEELEWALGLAQALDLIPKAEREGRVQRAHQRGQRSGNAVHAYFARKPFPRIRDVEQEVFTTFLGEVWNPAAPIQVSTRGFQILSR